MVDEHFDVEGSCFDTARTGREGRKIIRWQTLMLAPVMRHMGLHHPPSCGLGINQAFYTLAVATANVAMVLPYPSGRRERTTRH